MTKISVRDFRLLISRTTRLFTGVIGGYLFASSFMGGFAVGLTSLGAPAGEATSLAILIGVIVYIGAIIWIASTKHILRAVVLIVIASALAYFFAIDIR